jgi:hypothetical protein
MSELPVSPGDPPSALMVAAERLLRPLVRVFIAQGVTLPFIIQLLKKLYVGVAEKEFALDGKPQTDSRITLLTGVHRKDVHALRGHERDVGKSPKVVSRNAHLIAIWIGSPSYLDARGRPVALPKTSPRKGAVSFESLVSSVSKDIRPRAVLDEWERLNIVRVDENQLVHLNASAFVPANEFADLAFFFGRNLHDHLATSAHNLLGERPPMLEQAVYHEKLSPASVERLSALSRKLGSEALVKINRKAFEYSERDKGHVGAHQRITFGVYFHSAPEDADDKEE